MATKSSSKRARVSISVSLKKKICAYKKSHPKATQEEIRSLIFKEDSVDIGRTTISDILRDADKWASVEDSSLTYYIALSFCLSSMIKVTVCLYLLSDISFIQHILLGTNVVG